MIASFADGAGIRNLFKDAIVLRRDEGPEVHHVTVAACLHRNPGDRLIREVRRHDRSGSAQEGKSINRHARIPLRDQFRHAIPVAFSKDRESIARQFPLNVGVHFARRLDAEGFALFEPVAARARIWHHVIASFADGAGIRNLFIDAIVPGACNNE